MGILVKTTHDFVSGDKGLCELLQCGRTTVWKLKKSGLIDSAVHKIRGKTLYDVSRILEITKLV